MRTNKKSFLLVDGYNVINAWPDLMDLQNISLDEARTRLIDCMAELASITGDHLILVFDSYKVKNAKRQVHGIKGIEVVFTEESETADNYIEKVVAKGARNEVYTVASSDSTIQSMVFGKGASRISANELLHIYTSSKEYSLRREAKKRKPRDKNLVTLTEKQLKKLSHVEEELNKKRSKGCRETALI